MDSTHQQGSMFSRGGRIALAIGSLLFGLMLLLWASGQGALWKYAPAMFCFAIFGAIVFPPRLSRLCGYAIAFAIVVVCLQIAFAEFDGGSLDYFLVIGHILLTFGVPALVFLVKGTLPFEFGAEPPRKSSREEDDRFT